MFKQLFLMLSITLVTTSALADKYDDTIKAFRGSLATKTFFENAYGYAVFPTIGKAGLGIGGGGGSGKVYRGGSVTGETSVAFLTIGFQAGGQAYSQIIFFKDKRAYDEFTSGEFEFGAGVSAVAITAGAAAQSGTTGGSASATSAGHKTDSATLKYSKGMAVLTLAKGGLMYEASLSGQKYRFKPIK